MDIRVKDLMAKNVVTLPCTSTALEAARLIRDRKIDCVVITHNLRKLDGIITTKDLVRRVMAGDIEPGKITLDKVMSRDLKMVPPDMHIVEAVKLMAKHSIRRLPVVEKGKLIGIITDEDIMSAELSMAEVMVELFTFREGG